MEEKKNQECAVVLKKTGKCFVYFDLKKNNYVESYFRPALTMWTMRLGLHCFPVNFRKYQKLWTLRVEYFTYCSFLLPSIDGI